MDWWVSNYARQGLYVLLISWIFWVPLSIRHPAIADEECHDRAIGSNEHASNHRFMDQWVGRPPRPPHEEIAHHRCQHDGEDERTTHGKRHRVGKRSEGLSLHALKRKKGQEHDDDDGYGEYDRPSDFAARPADQVHPSLAGI